MIAYMKTRYVISAFSYLNSSLKSAQRV